MISYDYIRIRYEGKDFRNIAHGLKENHFFGDKQVWESFRESHFAQIGPVKDSEEKIKFDSENLEAYLSDRDSRFFQKTKNNQGRSFLDENIEIHSQQIKNKKSADEPLKLVSGVIDALDAINQKHPAFSANEVMEKVQLINDKTSGMLQKESPDRLLSKIIQMLETIKPHNEKNLKQEMLSKVKDIERIAYQMEKEIKEL